MESAPVWPRPTPMIGDASSARQRSEDPRGWQMDQTTRAALRRVIEARRDIRRFRPDPVPEGVLRQVIEAGHAGPSVGHSQPWRFLVVRDPALRDAAAAMADRQRLRQAAMMTSERGQHLLDLKLEGLREAPVGLVVACDRRTPATGVLGRATFVDADLWSCAAAIENMWLTARAEGLGMGWVTLFEPDELAGLLGLPEGVETLGWLCIGWPDELPPSPGLERLAWSKKLPLDDLILHDRWPSDEPTSPPNALSREQPDVVAPAPPRVVAATDQADQLLSPTGSLGVLDRALNRVEAIHGGRVSGGTLVLVGADHPVVAHGISAFAPSVTHDVLAASVAGSGMGVVTAQGAGLSSIVVDAGVARPVEGARQARPSGPRGDLVSSDGLMHEDAQSLLQQGIQIGTEVASAGLVVLGEVGIGNTTVAAALASALLGFGAQEVVGQGAGSDSDMVARKVEVVQAAVDRWRVLPDAAEPISLLAALGGGEFAVLTGVVLGAAQAGAAIVLDGLAASVPALLACRLQPSVQGYLVAGQASREMGHQQVLQALGLEPLLHLRLRCGEGVGACLAASMLLQGERMRALTARTC
ncbi:5,6-dimethylbenzimidazole synthase [Luteococcus sanguinis]|uniref:Nicotinate-nucleotide--dimethylbenzimidazole phosphoribosyltransferase n=1 Tax=Luteococcus sanguinis TaxID=174038 RepID=A0ABW1X1W2_9ACTN